MTTRTIFPTRKGFNSLFLSPEIQLSWKGDVYNLEKGETTQSYFEEMLYGMNIEECQAIIEKVISQMDISLSIIIEDYKLGKILCYTDQLGCRSLYMNDSNQISYSINELRNGNSKLDYQYLGLIRKFRYNQNNLTPYTNIKRLESGCIYTGFRNDFYHSHTITHIQYNKQNGNFLPLYLEEATANRLNSIPEGANIGVLLSGGLDSSMISAYLLKVNNGNRKLRFFCTDNAEDLEYAKECAEYLGIELEYLSQDDLTNDEIYDALETPVDMGSGVLQLKIIKKLKEIGITHVFTGEGGDDFFKGLKHFKDFDFLYHDIFNELVYYDFPKLEKSFTHYGIEVLYPFACREVIDYSTSHEIKLYKEDLHDIAHGLIPESIINRVKEPLKNVEVREDKTKYNNKMIDNFISYATK